jgi:hypothetical protein
MAKARIMRALINRETADNTSFPDCDCFRISQTCEFILQLSSNLSTHPKMLRRSDTRKSGDRNLMVHLSESTATVCNSFTDLTATGIEHSPSDPTRRKAPQAHPAMASVSAPSAVPSNPNSQRSCTSSSSPKTT